jgi:multicomponent K+:H+ antiporter subunit A
VKSLLLQTISRVILPPALLYAVYLLFRGHNLPGGGFVAGLMTAAAIILQYVASERRSIEDNSPMRPEGLIALGLAFAVLTGIGSMLFSYPFLTSTFAHVHVPVLGDVELTSALFFDLGVYFVVTGITLSILLAIEQ